MAGRTYKLGDLYREIGRKLSRPSLEPPADVTPHTEVTFAEQDPIRLRYEDGRVEVVLSLSKVKHKRSVFRNFKVHAFYIPEVDGLELRFVRDSVLEIEGTRLRPMSRNVLHGVFVKVFSRHRPLELTPQKLVSDKRFRGLMITQVDVDDGWLGLVGFGDLERRNDRRQPER